MTREWIKAALVGLGLTASGGAQADTGRRVALVIGNSAYENVAPLANPRNDASDFAGALMEIGFEVVEGYDLGRAAMAESIRDFAQKLDGAEVGLFYYAGHGMEVDGKNYMAPVDAALGSREALDFELVDMGLVLAQMEREPRVNLIFLDACRDNPLADLLARSLGGASRSVRAGGGLAALDAVAVGTFIGFAAQPGATAADGTGRNSPFTGALLRHIRTPGLEIQFLMNRVTANVLEATERRQVPWRNASMTEAFYFVPAPDGAEDLQPEPSGDPSARHVEVTYWRDVRDAGSIEQLQAYLDQYPDGAFVELARSRINALEIAATAPGGDPSSIEARYAKLAARDIIIPDPQEPHEFYNNARYYELRSDALNAGRMYARFITFGLEKVDPHYAYQDYLKAQEGRAGAREAYNELVYDHPDDPILPFAAALLQPPERRKAELEAYLARRPDVAPAVYELSNEYSARRLGSQTLGDRRNEAELLERFVALVESGDHYRYFMDQRLATEQIEDAEARLASLRSSLYVNLERPMSMSVMAHNGGWTLSFVPSELVKEVFVALPEADFASLGFQNTPHPITGERSPMMHLNLPPGAGAMTLRARYVDLRGQAQGPWSFDFDPVAERLSAAKSWFQTTKPNWVSLQPSPPQPSNLLLYFSHITSSYADQIASVRYGFDTDAPDRDFPIERWHGGADPSDDPVDPHYGYVDAPDDARFVSLQVTFIDGETTEIVRVDRTG